MKEYFVAAELQALAVDLTKLASGIEKTEAENEQKLKSETPYPLKRPEVLSEVKYIRVRMDALLDYINSSKQT